MKINDLFCIIDNARHSSNIMGNAIDRTKERDDVTLTIHDAEIVYRSIDELINLLADINIEVGC